MREHTRMGRLFPLSVGLVLGHLTLCASASAASFAGGTGRLDDPYQIATAEQLLSFGQDPNLLAKHFVLANDLDLDPNLPGGKTLTGAAIARNGDPTGDFKGPVFTGSLDGQGHKIKHLTIQGGGAGYLGLFGKTGKNAEIRNLVLEDVRISSSGTRVAGLAGYNRGSVTNCRVTGNLSGGTGDWCSCFGLIAGENSGRISHCDVDGRIAGAPATQGADLGLLVGWSWGIIQDCAASGTITAGTRFREVGGLTGENFGRVADSRASITITVDSKYGFTGYFGGLVGTNGGTICRSCSTGSLSCGKFSQYLGGLAGRSDGPIAACYASVDVSGTYANDQAGGLTGLNISRIVSSFAKGNVIASLDVGGLVGENDGSISQSYATGRVSADQESWNPKGGLVGDGHSYWLGATTCSFWDTQASEMATSDGGTGLATVQMKDPQTFLVAGWDFVSEGANGTADLWQMPQSGGTPELTIFSPGYQPHKLPGSGAPDDPYRIATAEDLGAICQHDTGACYQLVADINLAGITWTVPVIPSFEGRFDGNGFTISNLSLRGDCFLGLFGVLGPDAVVEKLQIDRAKIVAGDSASGLGLLAVENWGRITDCRVVGTVMGGSKEKKYQGVVEHNNGTITNCEPIADTGPYTTIITDPAATRWFLKYNGISSDDVWIPASKDLEGLEAAVHTYLDSDTPEPTRTWLDREYILTHFHQYNWECSGYVKGEGKYLICLMHLYDEIYDAQPSGDFTLIMDGGCSVVTVIFDPETEDVISIECNGEA